MYLCVFGSTGWLCGAINDSRGVKEFHSVCAREKTATSACVCEYGSGFKRGSVVGESRC